MALSLTELQAITEDYWLNKGNPSDIFFTDNVLLWKLMGKGAGNDAMAVMEDSIVKASELVDGGQNIRVFLEHGNSNADAYGKNTLIAQGKKDILNAARYRWAGYYASNAIDLDDQIQNSGSSALVDLAYTKLKNIEKTIRDQMGQTIFASAASSYDFLGLGNMFNTTTSTAYGTIAEDDMAQWKANNSAASVAISFKTIQALWRIPAVGMTREKKPNLGITTEVLKDGYERTLQSNQRFSDQKMVEAGFDNVLHKGAPIVADDNQTAGYFDALNTNFLKIKTHKDYNFTTPKWEYDKETPDTLVANTRWIGQLVCSHRKAQARYTALSEPA